MADSMKTKDSGLMKPWREAKKLPAKPAEAGAYGEGGQLDDGGVEPQGLAGDLVFPQRLPGTAERACAAGG